MQNVTSTGLQHCPDCGNQLETLWDYPSNELWCLHCGNRFYQTLSTIDRSDSAIGFRLLILDSDPERRNGLTGRFAKLGFHVTPVCHPRQALEAASFRHFDLTLLCADWPGIDTSALISKLRWQLGDVKFVVYCEEESASFSRQLSSPQVQCVRVAGSESHQELESTLEHFVEKLVAEQRMQVAATRWDLSPMT